ncbi:MAG: FAD:protein FMN transferase [Dysgonamonadaceae bacterium]|jgi:thiamine biosynthesis lipoprotein|nr:FAD:protein FMN transferase [Dysgonamonadaceae bacterium]
MYSGVQSVYNQGLLYGWFTAMHTRVDILLYGKPEEALRNVITLISDALHRLEMRANFFDSTSELGKLNQTAHLKPITVSDELFQMIALCKIYHEKTDGCFDISIRSDHYNAETFQSLILDEAHSTIYFTKQGLRLDLSGFLKGYALDKVREILQTHSIDNALVNIGNSSVMATGNHPKGDGWKVTVAATGKEYLLKNECLTTSGNETPGRKHIINPQTGKYVEGQRTVSVVTASGAEGEALATALFVAG